MSGKEKAGRKKERERARVGRKKEEDVYTHIHIHTHTKNGQFLKLLRELCKILYTDFKKEKKLMLLGCFRIYKEISVAQSDISNAFI